MNRSARRMVIVGAGLVLAAVAAGPALAATTHTAAKSPTALAHVNDPASNVDTKAASAAVKNPTSVDRGVSASIAKTVGSIDPTSRDISPKGTASAATSAKDVTSPDRASLDRASLDRASVDRASLDR